MNYADIGKNSNFDLRFVMFYLFTGLINTCFTAKFG